MAVIGENAVRTNANGFFGAGVKTMHEITPLQGIVTRAGDKMNVTYSAGYEKTKAGGLNSNLVERAVTAAKQADVAIIVAGLNHSRFLDDEGCGSQKPAASLWTGRINPAGGASQSPNHHRFDVRTGH